MIKTTQYIVVVCVTFLLASLRGYAQYTGGSADGAHTDNLNLTSCSNPPHFYAYFGGTADAATTDMVAYTTCSFPPQFFAYMGGTADGASVDQLNNTTCASPPHYFAYMGGTADGASNDQLNNTVCASPPQFYAYFGGSGDGFSMEKVINCSTLTPVADFSVGANPICVGQTVTYSDMSANFPSNWSWVIAGATPSVSAVKNPTVTYNTAGTYNATLTATNYNGSKTIIKTTFIVVNALPTLTVTGGAICAGQTFTINPSGANTYSYTGGSAIVSPTTTTSYTVTGTNAAGCTNTNVTVSTINVNALPVIAVNSGVICSGNSFVMNPTGASTFTYSSGSNTVTPIITTSYTVTGTSLAGCVSSTGAVSNVTVNITPTVSVNSGSICSGNSFTMIPTGANTYVYSGGTNIVSPISTTVYTVTGTSIDGCVSAPVTSSLIVSTTPTITVNSGTICSGQSFTIIPLGATIYSYSSITNVVTPIANSSYSVIGSTGACTSSQVISNVVVNAVPILTTSATATIICIGETATLTVMGTDTYSWSTSATSTVIAVSPTVTTNYTVIATNGFGCKTTAIVTESVSACVGIEELFNSNSIQVYPNPTNGILNIDISTSFNVTGMINENIKIELQNALGQVLLSETTNIQHLTFNISHLADGVYFLKTNTKTIRVVKN